MATQTSSPNGDVIRIRVFFIATIHHMSIKDDFNNLASQWSTLSLAGKVLASILLLSSVASLGSISDNIVDFAGFLGAGLALYQVGVTVLLSWLPFNVSENLFHTIVCFSIYLSAVVRALFLIDDPGRDAPLWVNMLAIIVGSLLVVLTVIAGRDLNATYAFIFYLMFLSTLVFSAIWKSRHDYTIEHEKLAAYLMVLPVFVLCVLAAVAEGISRVMM